MLGINLPYDPAIPQLGIHAGKTIIQKDTCTPVFIAALFTISRTWKQSKCPSTSEWIKMWPPYTMEHYSAIKRSETESSAEIVGETRVCSTEWSKSEREQQTLYMDIYMWNLEKWYR